MLTIVLTPTMITFKEELSDELANNICDAIPADAEMKWNEQNGYFVKGNEKVLYKTLLKLSYTYDIEIV